MIDKVFIIVPSLSPSGPIKGAIAVANSLADGHDVSLVAVKGGAGAFARIDSRVRVISLGGTTGGLRGCITAYNSLLKSSGGRSRVASLSMCLSADLVNAFCRENARTYASVRGNLIQNYRMDYGVVGIPLAIAHLIAMRNFDQTVAMSHTMARQMRFFSGRLPAVIPNFVDEDMLEKYRSPGTVEGALRFVFVGSLTRRKQPLLVIAALRALHRSGVYARLDVLGAGPLHEQLLRAIRRFELQDAVTLHGHLDDPYPLIARADAMILPSLSEGMSRAALEALYLGVPCVLRDADANSELVHTGFNGVLLRSNAHLAESMEAAARLGRAHSASRACLLPQRFRQTVASADYMKLVEGRL